MIDNRTKNLSNEKSDEGSKKNKRVRTVNLILALVLAVSLWTYVMGEVNPDTQKIIENVPLKILGENSLEKQGMVVLTEFDDSITAIVKGRRNNIYNINASKLSAQVDLSDCVIGENEIPVEVISAGEVSDVYAKEGSIVVTVDKIVEEDRNIDIAIGGKKNKGTEVEINSMDFDSVRVIGPSTYVENVDSVVGVLNLETGVGSYNQEVSLYAADKKGNKVEGVELEYSTVNVAAVETLTKSITVPVQTVGGNEAEYKYEFAENVSLNIKGNYDIIKQITSLNSTVIDLSTVTETTIVNMGITVPDGATAVDNEGKALYVGEDGVVYMSIEIKVEKINPVEEE